MWSRLNPWSAAWNDANGPASTRARAATARIGRTVLSDEGRTCPTESLLDKAFAPQRPDFGVAALERGVERLKRWRSAPPGEFIRTSEQELASLAAEARKRRGKTLSDAAGSGSAAARMRITKSCRSLRSVRDSGAGSTSRVKEMPGNFLYLGLVGLMLPGARIIRCVREPTRRLSPGAPIEFCALDHSGDGRNAP